MKKVLLLLFIQMLICQYANSQKYCSFPNSNAVWSVAEISQNCTSCRYQYRMYGDTVFNSTTYHKIYKLNDTTTNYSNSTYFGALREQDKKIYFRSFYCSHEITLYDFTKNIGDSIKNLFWENDLCADSWKGIISNIDSILIDNSYRKQFHIKSSDSESVWIEGIGSLSGLFNPLIPALTCSCEYNLVCLQQKGLLIYLNSKYSSYFPILTTIPNTHSDKYLITIFPNPVTNISKIKWNNSALFFKLEISNEQGCLVFTKDITNMNEMGISKNNLSRGIYFAKLITLRDEYYTAKFIVL